MATVEAVTATLTPLPTGTWKVDPVHSSVEFHVKHLGIATVKGQFKEFEGTLEVRPDGASAKTAGAPASAGCSRQAAQLLPGSRAPNATDGWVL